MKRLLIIFAALALLATPAAAAGPSKADKAEAQKECRDMRGTDDATREAKCSWPSRIARNSRGSANSLMTVGFP